MDKWKPHELKKMELGGNKNAAIFYEQNGMINERGEPNHLAPPLAKYKQELNKKVEMSLNK